MSRARFAYLDVERPVGPRLDLGKLLELWRSAAPAPEVCSSAGARRALDQLAAWKTWTSARLR